MKKSGDMTTLVIDDREKAVIPFFATQPIKYKVGRITTGDYVLLEKKKSKKAKPVIVFERKSWKDFSDSFKDGRFDNNKNLHEYRDKYNCRIVFVLEGQAFPSPKRKFRGIPFKNIQSRIDRMILKDGFFMVQTKNPEHTAKRINDMCMVYIRLADSIEKQNRQKKQSSKENSSKEESTKNVKGGDESPGSEESDSNESSSDGSSGDESSEEKSIVIPQDLKKVRQKTHDQVLLDMWRSLPQVSSTTASILSEHFTIKQLICGEIMVPQVSNLTYPSGVKVGEARAKKILEIGKGCKSIGRSGNVATLGQTIKFNKLQEKLLCSIKGVSRELAKRICKKYSLKQLCQAVDENELANLKRSDLPKARNLGPALAKRILTLLKSKN